MNNYLDAKYLKSFSKNELIRLFIKQEEIHAERINQLELTIQSLQLQVQSLQAKIQSISKDSSNSSKPPSSDLNKPQRNQSLREKSQRKSGGQNGHNGNTREQTDSPDKIVVCRPNVCNGCGKDISKIEGAVNSKRQEADIPPIKLEVTEYQQHSVICPCCKQTNLGQYPDHIAAPMQLGSNIKSFIVYLNIKHKIPYERLTQMFTDMLNVQISEGCIETTLETFKIKCLPFYGQVLSIIKSRLCNWTGSDETGIHVNGKKWWLWVWQNVLGTYYAASNSRGIQVVYDYFGKSYWGVLIHDCWSAQLNTLAKLGHQLCHPHLIRDLNYLLEAYKNQWCYQMKRLLLRSEKARDIIWAEGFKGNIRNQVIAAYRQELAVLLDQPLSTKKEIATIQKRFRKHRDKILYFMNFKDLPFHNNFSEQAIRNAKIHKKISGGFRSAAGAERHAVILSVMETCRKQKLNILDSLKQIYLGSFQFRVPE